MPTEKIPFSEKVEGLRQRYAFARARAEEQLVSLDAAIAEHVRGVIEDRDGVAPDIDMTLTQMAVLFGYSVSTVSGWLKTVFGSAKEGRGEKDSYGRRTYRLRPMYFYFEDKITAPSSGNGGRRRPGPEVCEMIVALHKSKFDIDQIAKRMKISEQNVKWAIKQAGVAAVEGDERSPVALAS